MLLALITSLSGGRVLVHDHIHSRLHEAHLLQRAEVHARIAPGKKNIGAAFQNLTYHLLDSPRLGRASRGGLEGKESATFCTRMASCVHNATDTLIRSHCTHRVPNHMMFPRDAHLAMLQLTSKGTNRNDSFRRSPLP